jgi:hypothetical protein
MRTIRDRQAFFSGMLFFLAGSVFALASRRYSLGTAARMGPGYFPFCLGLILGGLGGVQMLGACRRQSPATRLEHWDWRTVLLLTAAEASFAAAMHWLGLIPALAALVLLSSAASHEFDWKGAVANFLVILGLNLCVFVYGLSMPIPLWPEIG